MAASKDCKDMEMLCIVFVVEYSMVFSENNKIFMIQQFPISRYQEELEAEFCRSICICTFIVSDSQEPGDGTMEG